MLFHTPVFFFLFLPTVFLIYFLICKIKPDLSFYFLIISGLIFYAYWNIYLTPIIIFSIIINYFFAKKISKSQISNYVELDKPINCAGSFKSEALGISLFEYIKSDDPTALIGLPMIALISLLEENDISPI